MIVHGQRKLVLDLIQDSLKHSKDAQNFVIAWINYCHAIDDIIDEPDTTTNFILGTFLNACEIYSSNYWRLNGVKLQATVAILADTFANAENFKNHEDVKHRNVADAARHIGWSMVLAVIYIECGWEVMREISPKLWSWSIAEHHDETGKPT